MNKSPVKFEFPIGNDSCNVNIIVYWKCTFSRVFCVLSVRYGESLMVDESRQGSTAVTGPRVRKGV